MGTPGPPTTSFKMMTVVQPNTQGYGALRHTLKELAMVKQHIPSKNLVILGTPGKTATVEDVCKHLPDVSIAHFACHASRLRNTPRQCHPS